MADGCLPVAAIILAAGAATRMGRLKQLLFYRDKTLIENTVAQAMDAGLNPVIVVLGAESHAIRNKLASRPVSMVENFQWQTGMGSSVSAGVRHLQELATDSAAVAILLADQPLITAGHLRDMKQLFSRSGAGIVAARYGDALGVPALFGRSLFPVLAALEPHVGARALLRDPSRPVVPFDLPEAAIDVDTPDDFAALPGQ